MALRKKQTVTEIALPIVLLFIGIGLTGFGVLYGTGSTVTEIADPNRGLTGTALTIIGMASFFMSIQLMTRPR